jgi:hypothetical protein
LSALVEFWFVQIGQNFRQSDKEVALAGPLPFNYFGLRSGPKIPTRAKTEMEI